MAAFNKIILVGNLTRDPEYRVLPSGTALVSFGLAVSRRFNSRDGDKREETCFVDVKFFGRQAEIINEYVSKGRPILVEGRLDYSTWTGQDGGKRSKHEVVGESFQFLGTGRQERSGGDYQRGGGGRQADNRGGGQDQGSQYGNDSGYSQAGGLDDVPF